MNDWLTYKGSGSSRAYMGETISHRFLGIDGIYSDPGAKIEEDNEKDHKQRDADLRLMDAKQQLLAKKIKEKDGAKLQAQACTNDLSRYKKERDNTYLLLKNTKAEYKNDSSKNPLSARQTYAKREYELQNKIKDLDSKMAQSEKKRSEWINKYAKVSSECTNLQKEINEIQKEYKRYLSLKSHGILIR